MKAFLFKILLFFVPIVILPLLLYFIIDPFKVLYKYSEQLNTDKKYQITGNRDYQSTQLLLWNYKSYSYDSFILGNSRSIFYQANVWKTFVNGTPFHFNASAESLFGINGKLKLLEELNIPIKNVLIV
ncbi:MAG: hypothetical protein NTX97_05010, partial [Bacteroidetes bacterium]|nr:hypothetical protein [Bacteroidota bacterium]